jgi:hypothetical protein
MRHLAGKPDIAQTELGQVLVHLGPIVPAQNDPKGWRPVRVVVAGRGVGWFMLICGGEPVDRPPMQQS